jgi:glycosyltransferase involved in cell wall biosynthesis
VAAPLLAPIQKAANFVRSFLWPGLRAASFLKRCDIDLVHLNNSINGNHEWMLASVLARVPYVSHERGINPAMSRTSRFFARRAAALVCISRAIRGMLVAQGAAEATTVVVYNGIDPARVRPSRSAASVKAALGLAHDDPVIGVVGNLKQWKGQDTVVRATALLRKRWPSIRCLLVGATGVDVAFEARLRALVEELGLAGHVIFTGFQERPADYVDVMDVVVHASVEPEPFGRVNVEAMFLGKPVVSTNIGGPTEIFDDGTDGLLIAPGDGDLLADTVASLLQSAELRKRIGENARAAVLRRFTIAHTVRGVEAVYARILGDGRLATAGSAIGE